MLSVVAGLVLFLGDVPQVEADTVVLKNGDRITGTVVKKEGGELRFETTYAGTLTIDWAEVRSLQVDEPVNVLLEDESVVQARSIPGGAAEQPGRKPEGTKDAGLGEPDFLDDIDVIKPEPWELGTAGKFSGRVNAAMKIESGNVVTNEIDADFELIYRFSKHRLRTNGQIDYDRTNQNTVKQDWSLLNKYDYFLSDRAYLSANYGLRQEKFSGLNLRQYGGLGYGYEFWQGPPRSLQSELSLQFVNEDFVNERDRRFFGPGWNLNFEQALWKGKVTFYHRHVALLSAEEIEKFVWHSWTGFRVPIVGGVVGSAEYEIDYDSQPATQANTTDTTFRLKLGYEW